MAKMLRIIDPYKKRELEISRNVSIFILGPSSIHSAHCIQTVSRKAVQRTSPRMFLCRARLKIGILVQEDKSLQKLSLKLITCPWPSRYRRGAIIRKIKGRIASGIRQKWLWKWKNPNSSIFKGDWYIFLNFKSIFYYWESLCRNKLQMSHF